MWSGAFQADDRLKDGQSFRKIKNIINFFISVDEQNLQDYNRHIEFLTEKEHLRQSLIFFAAVSISIKAEGGLMIAGATLRWKDKNEFR